jgi:hypothetical protein
MVNSRQVGRKKLWYLKEDTIPAREVSFKYHTCPNISCTKKKVLGLKWKDKKHHFGFACKLQ